MLLKLTCLFFNGANRNLKNTFVPPNLSLLHSAKLQYWPLSLQKFFFMLQYYFHLLCLSICLLA